MQTVGICDEGFVQWYQKPFRDLKLYENLMLRVSKATEDNSNVIIMS